jgi:hypothetical protein
MSGKTPAVGKTFFKYLLRSFRSDVNVVAMAVRTQRLARAGTKHTQVKFWLFV